LIGINMEPTLTYLSSLARELVSGEDDLVQVDALLVAAQAGGESGVTALLELAQLIGEAADDAAAVPAALDRIIEADPLWLVASLVVACFAAVRADYSSRQDAQSARSAISARAEMGYAVAGV
jgi:hypothetical protein